MSASSLGRRRHGVVFPAPNVPSSLDVGFCLLLAVQQYVSDAGADVWQFALEIDELRCVGLINSDFRWLLTRGFVEHAQEITLPEGHERALRSLGALSVLTNTCFVLIDARIEIAGPTAASKRMSNATSGTGSHTEDNRPGDSSNNGISPDESGIESVRESKLQWDTEMRIL